MPLELETEAQEWFDSVFPFGRGFRRTVFKSPDHNPLEGWKAGAGLNMALRRRVLEQVGPFDEALDVGTSTHGGGDIEIFSRILAAGYRIVYDPAVLNWHRHQQTWREVRKKFYGYGIGGFAAWTRSLLIERELGVLKLISDSLRYRLASLARLLLGRPSYPHPPLDLFLAELLGCAVGPWAYLYSCWRLRSGRQDRP
jgi:GT2 family glycosyltransferase